MSFAFPPSHNFTHDPTSPDSPKSPKIPSTAPVLASGPLASSELFPEVSQQESVVFDSRGFGGRLRGLGDFACRVRVRRVWSRRRCRSVFRMLRSRGFGLWGSVCTVEALGFWCGIFGVVILAG